MVRKKLNFSNPLHRKVIENLQKRFNFYSLKNYDYIEDSKGKTIGKWSRWYKSSNPVEGFISYLEIYNP